jgi:hypothetical protein
MAPTIRIDDDLYALLKAQAEPFVDTPNSVIRRLIGLPAQNGNDAEPATARGETAKHKGRARRKKQRASKRPAASRSAGRRAPTGTLLPEPEYEMPILEILLERGGKASSRDVIDSLEKRLNGRLTDLDREPLRSGAIRWRNRAQFVRLSLVKKGDLAQGSPRGVWELTDAGRRRASK